MNDTSLNGSQEHIELTQEAAKTLSAPEVSHAWPWVDNSYPILGHIWSDYHHNLLMWLSW